MRRVALAFALSLAGAVHADQNGAFQDANALAGSKTDGMFSGVASGSVSDKIPGYGTNPSESQLFQGGQGQLSDPGVAKMQNCAAAPVDSDPIKRQECEAVNFLARNPDVRPQFNITNNDPMILGAKDARNNAESFFQSLGIAGGTGASSQCTTRTETTPEQYTTETCTSLREVGTQQCTMGRQVNLDADANYQCDKTVSAFTSQQRQPTVTTSSCSYGRQINLDEDSRFQCDQTVNAYETLKCHRSSSVTCTGGGDGCDQGGIVPGSWQGDMAVSWAPAGTGDYNLTFGTIGDNYWGGWGTIYDRTLTFNIKDKSLITRFALTRAAFDDWLWVKVNDNTVYVGPYGGDRLYVIGQGSPVGDNSFCYQNDWSGQWSCYQYIGWSETPTQVGTYQYCAMIGWDVSTWYCNNDGPPGYVKYGPAANQYGSPELSTSWNVDLNIDIRPYLKDGLNTVWMRTIVAGGGEGAVVFTTRQRCPVNCSVSTDNQCAALEARSE